MADCPVCDDRLPGATCTCPTAPAETSRIDDVAGLDPMPYPTASPDRPPLWCPAHDWPELLASYRWIALWNRDAQAAADANPHRRGTTRARKGTLRKATW